MTRGELHPQHACSSGLCLGFFSVCSRRHAVSSTEHPYPSDIHHMSYVVFLRHSDLYEEVQVRTEIGLSTATYDTPLYRTCCAWCVVGACFSYFWSQRARHILLHVWCSKSRRRAPHSNGLQHVAIVFATACNVCNHHSCRYSYAMRMEVRRLLCRTTSNEIGFVLVCRSVRREELSPPSSFPSLLCYRLAASNSPGQPLLMSCDLCTFPGLAQHPRGQDRGNQGGGGHATQRQSLVRRHTAVRRQACCNICPISLRRL